MSYVSSALLENGGNDGPKNGAAGNQHTFKIEIISINRHNYTKTHLLNPTVPVNLDNNGVFLA